MTSADGQIGFAQVQFAGQATEVPVATQEAIADLVSEHKVDGLEIAVGGAAVKQTPSIGSTEGIGVIVALIVLLITFGSVVAAGLPMLTALIGVGVGMAGILTVSGFVQMSSTAPILALMLGLAVGIDYALFIVSRHRNQLRHGMGLDESIARATGTAGSAVLFAGLTVLIALAALSVVGIPFLTIMGLAAAATIGVAVLIALTLLPALLGFAGEKVLRRKDRAAVAALRAGGRGASLAAADVDADLDADATFMADVNAAAVHRPPAKEGWWIRFVTRRPIQILIGGVLIMGVMAIPVASLHLALPDDGRAAPDSTKRQAYDLLADAFGPGFNGPLVIVTVEPTDPSQYPSGPGCRRKVHRGTTGGCRRRSGRHQQRREHRHRVGDPDRPALPIRRRRIWSTRSVPPRPNWGTEVGATIAVTGQTALQIDVSDKLASALPIYLAIVIGLALILLMLVFRSIIVPIKAAIGFLFTIGVSFGAVVAVYQWGWLSGVFGVHTPEPIISFLPILLIGVLFGLAMDYEVFLVSGMRESFVHSEQDSPLRSAPSARDSPTRPGSWSRPRSS